MVIALALVGPALAIGGYAASLLPAIYEQTDFWTSSPTFFFLRLGVLLGLVPIAYAWNALVPGRSPLRELGITSLFVYWIHVEMVYGVVSTPLHRQLTFPQALVAFVAFSGFLFALVKLKDQWLPALAGRSPFRLPLDSRSGHPEQRRGVKAEATGNQNAIK
jgi:hypothetical protein